MDNILVIFQATFNQAGRWPIGIYPGWLRVSLTFLIPVAFAVTVPAESVTVTRWFWRFGLRHCYTGASA